jgi:hypothetical protein
MDVNELLNQAAAEYLDEEFEEDENNNNDNNNIKVTASEILRESAQKVSIDENKMKDAMKKEVMLIQLSNNYKENDEAKLNEDVLNNHDEDEESDGDDVSDDDDNDDNGDTECNLLLLIACYRGDHNKVALLLSGKSYEDDESVSNKKASFKAKDQHGWYNNIFLDYLNFYFHYISIYLYLNYEMFLYMYRYLFLCLHILLYIIFFFL